MGKTVKAKTTSSAASAAPTAGTAANSPVKAKPTSRGTIITKRRSPEQIKKDKPRPKGFYLEGELLDGSLSRFTLTLGNPRNDGYHDRMQKEIDACNEEVLRYGILGGFYMKRSLKDERPLLNEKDDYTKKMFIMSMEAEEMNHEGLLKKMQFVLEFFKRPENNTYATTVFLPNDWDKTPPQDQPLRKLCDYLQYTEIKKLIKKMNDDAGPFWYENNEAAAWAYFREGHVPTSAALDLGFPDDKVTPAYVQREHVSNNPLP